MKQFNIVFSFCVAVLLAGITYLTVLFPENVHAERFGPAFYPLTLVCVIVVLLVLFLLENRRQTCDARLFESARLRRPLAMGAAFVALILLLEPIGFPLSGFAFLLATTRFFGTPWRTSLAVAAIVTGLIYLMFKIVLQVPIPLGALWETLS